MSDTTGRDRQEDRMMSPMDRSKYHPDWEWISRQIREQAGNRCEFCLAPNGEDVWRWSHDGAAWVSDHIMRTWPALVKSAWCGVYVNGPTRIVLTCAHLDHDPGNNDPANLKALCSRCHLRWDQDHHQRNAAETRRVKRETAITASGQQPLIDLQAVAS